MVGKLSVCYEGAKIYPWSKWVVSMVGQNALVIANFGCGLNFWLYLRCTGMLTMKTTLSVAAALRYEEVSPVDCLPANSKLNNQTPSEQEHELQKNIQIMTELKHGRLSLNIKVSTMNSLNDYCWSSEFNSGLPPLFRQRYINRRVRNGSRNYYDLSSWKLVQNNFYAQTQLLCKWK